MLNLIVAILAPMFVGVTGGDIDLARQAAVETVNAYSARNNADLIAITQIIACGLAALGSLSLSMGDDISIVMALRLRGNANGLNRSAEQNRRAIRQGPSTTDMPNDIAAEPCQAQYKVEALADSQEPQPAPVAPKPTPSIAAPVITDRQQDAMWAAAMAEVAKEFTASLPNLPPMERELAERRAAALSSTASELIAGRSLPPFRMRPG